MDALEKKLQEFAEEAYLRGECFFYIKIPGNIFPLERADNYADPIDEYLNKKGVGEVVGGGSQLGDNNSIEFCGIDVVVWDRDAGLKEIKSILSTIKLPDKTRIFEFYPNRIEHNTKEDLHITKPCKGAAYGATF